MTKNPTNSLEVSFLGAILNPLTTARVMALVEKRHVTEAWFDSAEAKRVWQSVEELWRKHRAVDGVLVMQALALLALLDLGLTLLASVNVT